MYAIRSYYVTTWQENKMRQDNFEIAQNEKLKKEIQRLETSSAQMAGWSDKIEASKIGTHAADRGYIGMLSAKMMRHSISVRTRRVITSYSIHYTKLYEISGGSDYKVILKKHRKFYCGEDLQYFCKVKKNMLYKKYFVFDNNDGLRYSVSGIPGEPNVSSRSYVIRDDAAVVAVA